MKVRTRWAGDWFVAVVCSLIAVAGCDMGLDQSSNRYEQLNIETKKLTEILEQITDEASAKAQQSEIEELGAKMRDLQKRIAEREAEKAKTGKGGMGNITNARQASLFQQTGDAARRQADRIRQEDDKAGVIVDAALEGVEFPPPPPEAALQLQ